MLEKHPPVYQPPVVGLCARLRATEEREVEHVQWDLLETLADKDLESILERALRRTYGKGEALFHEGDAGDTLHLVETGRVAIRIVTPDGDTATLAVLGPGEAFGEMALLRRSSQRSASAFALEAVTTLTIHKDVFTRLRSDNPAIERFLVSVLAARVDRLSKHLMDALYASVETRVVRRLLETASTYADDTGKLVLPLTQEDIAGLAGTTRPTANQILKQLEDAGVLALSRGKVEIVDRAALARRAR
jgi:CRP/FNR family cyclic AMP-dependent transcriptional regulator